MASVSRPIARVTISFGLVAIPVKLHSAAVPSERLSLHLMRKSDGSRVKEQFVAVTDGKIVERSDMVKGIEVGKGKYVSFTPAELKALEDDTSPTLGITSFVPLDTVDPLYFMVAYYLIPDKGGEKPYALLASALQQERRCAVGQWTSRGKEHVIIIRSSEQGLILHQLHFKAEIRSFAELKRAATKVSDAEVKLARQLIEHLAAARFDPKEFVDEHRARVQAEIKRKAQGKGLCVAPSEPPKGRDNVVSLMDALKASLQRGAKAAGSRKTAKKAARKRRSA